MTFQDKTGQKVPDVVFRIRKDFEWLTKTSDDLFKNKRIILFALPGAFTPTCSNIHLPSYNDLYECFLSLGIDDVICLSVNDSYVMNEWKKHERVEKITMLPDGNGEFTRKLGFLTDKSDECLGERSWRYSMVVNDGIIEKMFIEPENGENDPYGESGPENILRYLDPKVRIPDSVTIFTRHNCKYSEMARVLLRKKNIPYEELILNEGFSIKTVKALSGSTKLPQIFINGKRIGGAEDLEKYLRFKAAA